MLKERYITPFIRRDLRRKMVFVGGPRQVGKTTLALGLLCGTEKHPAYFSYDDPDRREQMLARKWRRKGLIALDEIHKYPRWKNWLKGVYDTSRSGHTFLVTGSARLDVYRRGGDSMLGRYHYYRLHPFSFGELVKTGRDPDIERLLECGGFPEPYFEGNLMSARRWRRERRSLVLREDVRDLQKVMDLTHMELMAMRLPELVGNPLSINALAEDLRVHHATVVNWLMILERLYYCYRIYPFGSDRIRAVKKEAKLYLWDWSEIQEPGFRFENMIAGHLLKYCHFIEDTEGYDMELRYLRDRDKREVDFVVLRDRKPLFAVECKLSVPAVTSSMHYFRERTPIPKFYLVHGKTDHFQKADPALESIPAETFLKTLV